MNGHVNVLHNPPSKEAVPTPAEFVARVTQAQRAVREGGKRKRPTADAREAVKKEKPEPPPETEETVMLTENGDPHGHVTCDVAADTLSQVHLASMWVPDDVPARVHSVRGVLTISLGVLGKNGKDRHAIRYGARSGGVMAATVKVFRVATPNICLGNIAKSPLARPWRAELQLCAEFAEGVGGMVPTLYWRCEVREPGSQSSPSYSYEPLCDASTGTPFKGPAVKLEDCARPRCDKSIVRMMRKITLQGLGYKAVKFNVAAEQKLSLEACLEACPLGTPEVHASKSGVCWFALTDGALTLLDILQLHRILCQVDKRASVIFDAVITRHGVVCPGGTNRHYDAVHKGSVLGGANDETGNVLRVFLRDVPNRSVAQARDSLLVAAGLHAGQAYTAALKHYVRTADWFASLQVRADHLHHAQLQDVDDRMDAMEEKVREEAHDHLCLFANEVITLAISYR